MAPEVQEWLNYAKMDLDTADHLYNTFHPRPLQIICFHCQQAAEKSIKAIVVAKHLPNGLPKSHDLEFLLEQIKNYVHINNEFWDYAERLTVYGIQARYPNNNIDFTNEDTVQAIIYTRKIFIWANQEIEGTK